MPRSPFRDIVATFVISAVLLLSLAYVYFHPDFDATTLLVGVLLPLLFGTLVFAARRSWVLLFAFLAYFWSLVDDKPVQFDSVLTWPEVTRFHPATPHIFMEVVLHALTLLFMVLAVRQALGGAKPSTTAAVAIGVLTLVAFGLSYAQNIPLDSVQSLVTQSWFPLDLIEHASSLVFFWFAVQACEAVRQGRGTSRT